MTPSMRLLVGWMRQVVQRARQEDLDKPVAYKCAFVRNPAGKVVMDRKFNTEELLRCIIIIDGPLLNQICIHALSH